MRYREALRISGLGLICAAPLFALHSARAEEALPLPGLEDVPAVVAEVNGHPISREDLVRELAGPSGQQAIGRLIRRILVEQEAAAEHITVSNDEIEAQYKVDARDLMNELIHVPWVGKNVNAPAPSVSDVIRTRFNMNTDEYKKLVVRQKLLIRRCVAKDINPTQAQLRDFFAGMPGADDHFEPYFFQPPTKYHACHILISPMDPRDWYRGLRFRTPAAQMTAIEQERKKIRELYRDNVDLGNAPSTAALDPEWKKSRALAEKVMSDIKSGVITWDQALRTYTQDLQDRQSWNPKKKKMDTPRERFDNKMDPGDVGWFTAEGPLVKEFYEGAKNLRPGGPDAIGGPVQTEFGFHLIKMIEVKEEPQRTFEQCAAEVEKAYIEYIIQKRILPVISYKSKGPRQPGWLDLVMAKANIVIEPAPLWPPRKTNAMLDVATAPAAVAAEDPDPIVARVNDAIIHRSDVWRELLRYDSDVALTRLIHREIILAMLKPMGVARMDWECGRKELRDKVAPPAPEPIQVSAKEMDDALQSDYDRLNLINTERKKQKEAAAQRLKENPNAKDIPKLEPELSFADYVFRRYGRTVEEYRRSLEATAVVLRAVRKKVPIEDGTLRVEFALGRDEYSEPAWFEISHILIVPRGGMSAADNIARLDAKSIADNIFMQCSEHPEHERFEQLVAEFSEDAATRRRRGVLGACYADGQPNINQLYNAADQLSADDVKMIYTEIKDHKLEPGHFAPVLATSRGYHIVRVDAVHPERKVDYDEVKDRLRYDYLTQHAKMLCDIWLRQLELDNEKRITRYFGDDRRKLELPRDDVPDNWMKELPKPDSAQKK